MKIRILIITIITSLLFQSCDDELDIQPVDGTGAATLYQTDAGAVAGLMGVYSRIFKAYRQTNFNALYPVSGTDEGFENRNGTRNFLENNHTSSDGFISEAWTLLYEGVNAANIMLDEVEKSGGLSESSKAIFTAEGRFIRAYLLFDLQRAFGGIDGIPLPTEETLKELLPRSKGVDVYAQIISDLEYAASNLADIQDVDPGRASKSAAQGLLARVCLQRAGAPFTNDGDYYTKASVWAKKVIDGGYHQLNPSYEDVFKKLARSEYDTQEVLFQIAFYYGNQDNQQAGKLGSTIGLRIDNNNCKWNRGYSLITSSITLINAYRSDPTDERGLWNTSPYYISGGTNGCETKTSDNQFRYGCSKYRQTETPEGSGAGSWGSQHWPVLRYSDVLLMYAEAENQLSAGSANALNAVNEVRNRANATPLGAITTELIQEERRLELCYEGLRKHDLVRWGIMQQKVDETLAAHIAADGNPNLDWPIYGTGGTKSNTLANYYMNVYESYDDSKHRILPIPEQEIGANTLVTQNPNW